MWVTRSIFLAGFLLAVSAKSTSKSVKDEYYTNPQDYSFDQIYKLLGRSLKCLEKTPDLTVESTFEIVQALAYIYQLRQSAPGYGGERKKLLEKIEVRLQKFITRSKELYPNYPGSVTWYPYWGETGEYSFLAGRVPTNQPFKNKHVQDILNDNKESDFVKKCKNDIFAQNEVSNVPRACNWPCQKEMTDMHYDSGIPPYYKIWNLGFAALLNCTNLKTQTYEDYAVHLCAYVKRELDTILRYKNTNEFSVEARSLLNDRATFCAAWGMPEFLSPEILTLVVNALDCNGCVTVGSTDEERQLLQSQTVAFLSITSRMITESDYKNKRLIG